MKKIVSLAASAILAAASILPLNVSAESEKYIPTFYFKANNSENANTVLDRIVHISPSDLKNGDVTVNISVYLDDDIRKTYSASAKWRSNSEYVTLENLVNPTVEIGPEKEYTTSDGKKFFTKCTPFCFASINDDNSLKIPMPDMIEKPEINSMYFTYISRKGTTFPLLGASSDEYPLTSFDAVVSSDTPEGVYDIVFATKQNTDGDNSVISHGAIMLTETNFYSYRPITRDLKIVVGDYKLGDVDENNIIDADDASYVLKAYACQATGKESGLTELQLLAANVNGDRIIDADDASIILAYYAYKATGGELEFPDYLAQRK